MTTIAPTELVAGRKPRPAVWWRDAVPPALLVAALAACALTGVVPLTYDEAFNYSYISRHGFAAIRAYDEFPNNHLAFTLLQGLLPRSWVEAGPHLLRAPNLVYGAVLVWLLLRVLSPLGRERAWLAVAVLLGGPYLTLYLLVARGYLLGTLLTFAAAIAIVGGRFVLGGVLAGLAGATVPTFAFALPGMPLALLGVAPMRAWLRPAVAFSAPALAIVGIAWVPHHAALADHSRHWGIPLGDFLFGAFASLANHWWLSAACVAAVVVLTATSRRAAPIPVLSRVLWSSFLSFLVVCSAASAIGGTNAPYLRAAAPLTLLVAVGLALAAHARGGFIWKASATLLLANGAVGASVLWQSFGPGGDLRGQPGFAELNPTTSERVVDLHRTVRIEAIEGAWAALPVGRLYAESIGVPWREVPQDSGPLQCAWGRVPPLPFSRIWVVHEGERRLVCW